MTRLAELATTTIAGAIGSIIAVLLVGASLLLVLPVALGVGAIALLAARGPGSSASP